MQDGFIKVAAAAPRIRVGNVAHNIDACYEAVLSAAQQGARVVVEDYSGTFEFALFGKDYQNWLPYMQLRAQIFIEGDISPRYFPKGEERTQGKRVPYGFKIQKITLLGNLGEERITALSLILESDRITPEFRERLVRLLKRYKGKAPLQLQLHDRATGYNLEFKSKKYQMSVCEPLISGLQQLGVPYDVKHK